MTPCENRFSVVGQFCSWECMKAYNLHSRNAKFGEVQSNMSLMRKRMYGNTSRIHVAPDRFMLKKFGGSMTDDEFRACRGKEPLHSPHARYGEVYS